MIVTSTDISRPAHQARVEERGRKVMLFVPFFYSSIFFFFFGRLLHKHRWGKLAT